MFRAAIHPFVRQTLLQSGSSRASELVVINPRLASLTLKLFSTSPSALSEDEDKVAAFLKEHSIRVLGKGVPSPVFSFEESSMPNNILQHVLTQFGKPTPIQAQALPIALEGTNMVGIGQTGSGKTLAFLLPALAHIQKVRAAGAEGRKFEGPVVLILSPTRELALQIQEVGNLYRRATGVKNVCCIGGDARGRQLRDYDRGPELMIATPGRLNDFLQSREMTISDVDYVVLDEADRMLDMGFEPQIRGILEKTKEEKQVLMFSATWPKEVKELAEDFLGTYTFMNIGSTELSANKNITQKIVVTDRNDKKTQLMEAMEEIQDQKTLIFCETKRNVDWLERHLNHNGVRAMGIHGDKSQSQRSMTIKRFKGGQTNVMIATDVAARGLDISGVMYVINYDFPKDIENYIHRIGRTGRSDNKGTSITFVTDEDPAKKIIKILKESNQEVPQELVDLARNSHEDYGNSRSRYFGAGGSKGSRNHNSFGYGNQRRQSNDSWQPRRSGGGGGYGGGGDYDYDRASYNRNSRNSDYDSGSFRNSRRNDFDDGGFKRSSKYDKSGDDNGVFF